MEGVIERLPAFRIRRIGLPADEIGLPRRHAGNARNLFELALRRRGVVGLRRGADQDDRDVVTGDQLLRHFRGAVRIRLAVLGHDLDRVDLRADLKAVLDEFAEFTKHEIVGLGEGGERAASRRDVADLDRLCGANRRAEQRHRAGGSNAAGDALQIAPTIHS
jgi:hypothetical protein